MQHLFESAREKLQQAARRHAAACEWEILRAAEHGQRIVRLDQHIDHRGMLNRTELVTADELVWATVPGFHLVV